MVKFKKNIPYEIIVCFVFLTLFTSPLAMGEKLEKPRIKHFRVTETPEAFRVTGVLYPAFQPDILDTILAGTPTTFRFEIHLKELRWYWDNKILKRESYLHTVVYDTLRKTYKVTIVRESDSEVIIEKETESRQEMQELMTIFEGYLSKDLKDLDRDDIYVSMSATLTTRQLPSPWNELLFFLSNDFETETSRKFFPEHH